MFVRSESMVAKLFCAEAPINHDPPERPESDHQRMDAHLSYMLPNREDH